MASAVYFAHRWQGSPGTFLCISTQESTAASKYNSNPRNQVGMEGIQNPEWLSFQAYFYAGLAFGNYEGFNNPGAVCLGTLGDVLQSLCTEARMQDWRALVYVRHGGWVYGGLRHVLSRLGVGVHGEVVSGLSYQRLRSLDVYVSTHSGLTGTGPSPMARWNVAYDDPTWVPAQDQWWHMPVWRSTGQVDVHVLDYQPEFRSHSLLSILDAVRPAMNPMVSRRLGIVIRHVHPGATPDHLRSMYEGL